MSVHRIPVRKQDGFLTVTEPYVLMVPTYGGGNEGGAVPRRVREFLNDPHNRSLARGVIAAGNTNFGAAYCSPATSSPRSARCPTCTPSNSWGRLRTPRASVTDWDDFGNDSH